VETRRDRDEDAGPPPEPLTASGEIIAIEATAIRVRLRNGVVGHVPVGDDSTIDTAEYCVGHRAVFRIVRRGTDGEWVLSALSPDEQAAQHEFDREFDRLLSALSNHRPSKPPEPQLPPDPLGKEEIEQWVTRVGDAVTRVRKNRAKRQNERFYNE